MLHWLFARLYRRVAAGYVALLTLVLAALGIYLAGYLRDEKVASLEAHLYQQALVVADYMQYRLLVGDPRELALLAENLGHESGFRITLIASDGTVWGDSERDASTMDNHLSRPEVQQALQFGSGQSQRYSRTLEQNQLYVAVPIRSGERSIGVARTSMPVQQLDSSIQRLALSVAGSMGVACLLAIGLALLLARITTSRIETVTAAARRLADGELDVAIQVPGNDEVGWLADAFNHMASSLGAQMDALDTERAHLDAILTHMADGVLILDEQGTVLTVNPAAVRLLQQGGPHPMGRSLMMVVRDHEIASVVAELIATHKEVGPRVVEIGSTGNHQYVQVAAAELPGAEGASPRMLLLLQDVSELRRAEIIRREFVANVSHELRTPLSSLRALVETLEDGALEDTTVARDFLVRMHQEVDRLAKLIEELLQLGRLESGQTAVSLRPVELGIIVRETVVRSRSTAERSNIKVAADVAPDLPLVLADPDRLQQVLGILLHNAIKFSHAGQEVLVEAQLEGGSVIVSVQDEGIGISAESLGRVFERFYQSDSSRASKGAGLGLAIAKHAVQMHGGQIWAESAGEGRGARFSFTLSPADV